MSSNHEDDVPSVPETGRGEAATATSTSTSTSPDREPERKGRVFEGYSDPEADVVLASDDGVLFRVHSYILKASSSVFRDMFTIPKSDVGMQGKRQSQQRSEQLEPEPEPETSHIDASPNVLAVFLDMMHSDPVPTKMDSGILESIVTLADKYGCDVVIERVLLRASGGHLVTEAPWEVFRLAARYHYPQIAKLALSMMHCDKDQERKKMSTTSLQLDWIVEIPLNYLLVLVVALGKWENGRVNRISMMGHHPHAQLRFDPFHSPESAKEVSVYFESTYREIVAASGV